MYRFHLLSVDLNYSTYYQIISKKLNSFKNPNQGLDLEKTPTLLNQFRLFIYRHCWLNPLRSLLKVLLGDGWGKYIYINPGFTSGLDHLDQKTGKDSTWFLLFPHSFILSIFLALFWECAVRALRRRRALKRQKTSLRSILWYITSWCSCQLARRNGWSQISLSKRWHWHGGQFLLC